MRRLAVPAGWLLFTYLFFIEYLRPFKFVSIPYDLNVYHYSLDDYAYRALHAGRFPAWDPTQFCGIGFVSNINAQLFYPPVWILFLANWGRDHLSYSSLEVFLLVHVWLAAWLCYRWLRARELSELACLFGTLLYAFSGYACLNLQHLGLIVAYAWFPLGLEGIDGLIRTGRWTSLIKLVAASALAFVGGYPPTWLAFAVYAAGYALFSFNWKVVAGTFLALVASLFLAAAQLMPTMEASSAKMAEQKYGTGITDLGYYISYLIPNYYNFGLNMPVLTNPGRDYLYLGAPALIGIALLYRFRKLKLLAPFIGAGIAGAIFITNPYNLVWTTIQHSKLLADVIRSGYFLVVPIMAITPLAAYGIDDFWKRKARPLPNWIVPAGILIAIGYSCWHLARWANASLPAGPQSLYDAVIVIILTAALLYGARSQSGSRRAALAAAALLVVAADYKAFGTSKRFNAAKGDGSLDFVSSAFPGMGNDVVDEMLAHPEYRILRGEPGGPHPLEIRHAPFNTAQGFDPFFTTAYRATLLEIAHAKFYERDQFIIGLNERDAWKLYGVRYFITSAEGQFYPELMASPDFRLVNKTDTYYKIFEYKQAEPPFGWETQRAGQQVKLSEWQPEHRVFDVRSDSGGRFTFREQFLPGWEARIDGRAVPIERWTNAFQAVQVAPGSHRVDFQFRPKSMFYGIAISLISIVLLTAAALLRRKRGR